MSALACGTIVAKSYLSFARVLAASFRRYHPAIPFFVLLADEVDGYFEPFARAIPYAAFVGSRHPPAGALPLSLRSAASELRLDTLSARASAEAGLLAGCLLQAGKPGARRPHVAVRCTREGLDRPDPAPAGPAHGSRPNPARAEHPPIGHVQRRNPRSGRHAGDGSVPDVVAGSRVCALPARRR